ncbi:MAG: transcription elongation factor GreB [Myxococcota bacterium]
MAEQPKKTGYITPAGYQKLATEMDHLTRVERPKVVQEVSDAAAQGDRSENAEYIYGKKRLREIDRRLNFLQSRLDAVQVVDPLDQKSRDTVFFGATVTIEDENGKRSTYVIVGEDEIDTSGGRISYKSPMAQALIKKKVGDVATVRRPAGEIDVEIVEVRYVRIT